MRTRSSLPLARIFRSSDEFAGDTALSLSVAAPRRPILIRDIKAIIKIVFIKLKSIFC